MVEASKKIDEKLVLDWGARIGFAARVENVRPAQLENLLASLDTVEGPEALLVTAAFAQRQAERLGTGRTMARLINQAMLELYERGAGKDEARRMLGFAKWIYEALGTRTPRGVRPDQLTLHDLLKQLR